MDGHWALVASLLQQAGTAGNLTTDAHLAALALQHGCELCSTDTDFAPRPRTPLAEPVGGLSLPFRNAWPERWPRGECRA
ncbi:MAG: hypothetical protein A3K19_01105 [Lentisphaerae bacterium RIFOXYB12_FULL_65_16]|nr:MAG: hypothetical protein A3K18_21800 [Lentisphaerae bacterium RIFOXYA12_64_32]OGV93722.1 MAG: hypothetical protein A3K19_01105 [Lentisphaerae bacterium RIFOXYB12_FULL_65_16]